MHKSLFVIFLFSQLLFSAMQNVELVANSITKNGNQTEANGDVLVYSEKYFISADRALYDEKSSFLELFGNVNIMQGEKNFIKSSYAKININNNSGEFKPFFSHESIKDVWLECESAKSDKQYYFTKNSIVSSCDVQKPAWKIAFSEGKLNKQSRFLQLKNVVFYLRSVPIFYFPYFAFSTDTTRKTGLLIPKFGYGFSDGFYYAQPIYVAEDIWWDLEITPQIRTKRGKGIYISGRFVDTPNSKGEITVGVFEDKNSYAKKEKLKNTDHYGYELKYQNDSLASYLVGDKFDDGLWIDFTYLNDVDYLNLKHNGKEGLDNLVTSRLNYYVAGDDDYFGLYAKYYIDTSKVDNDKTLQELPTLQYHHFLDSLILPNVLYSLDVNYHRYHRKQGVNARQLELDLPITFHTSFFDDFLKFSASENIYATYVEYDGKQDVKSETFTRNFHKFSLFTELAKPYENFYHTMRLGLDYIVPSWDNGKITEDFISTQIETEKLRASLVQYFYNSQGKRVLRHSVSQAYNINNTSFHKNMSKEPFDLYYEDNYKYGDLKHRIDVYLNKNFIIKNNLNYSYKRDKFSKVQSSLHVKNRIVKVDLIHTYLNNPNSKNSFISANINYNYDRHHTLFSDVNYDFKGKYSKMWQFGLHVRKKCYNYTVSYKEETKPKLTSAGVDYVKKEGFYASFELYPFGGTEYDFSHESSL